jgi:hypothetical protein
MNQNEKQRLVNEYQRWLRTCFLPGAEKINEMNMEDRFDGLSSVFASFVFRNPVVDRLPSFDMWAILSAYKEHLQFVLEQMWMEEGNVPSSEEQKHERDYHFWPLSIFVSAQQAAAETN